jgi:hypothetical protein
MAPHFDASDPECPCCTSVGLIDPMDDGTISLPPGAFDPLTELHGEPYPRDAVEAEQGELGL